MPQGGEGIHKAKIKSGRDQEHVPFHPLNALKKIYQYSILDSPPLLSTSDPKVLSKFVDGILIVVRAGVTARETLKQTISSLEKEKILGFVLIDLEFKSSGLSSRYFGSDYSYYGYGKRKKQLLN